MHAYIHTCQNNYTDSIIIFLWILSFIASMSMEDTASYETIDTFVAEKEIIILKCLHWF